MEQQELRDKICKYIHKHEDLIYRYDSTQDNIPVQYCIDDIIEQFEKLKNISPDISLNYAMTSSLKYAIEYGVDINEAFENLIARKIIGKNTPENVIQAYFADVGEIYKKNNNNFDIKYCPENRDKLIEMNLKTVISIAKRYQGLGLDLADLISAGNIGLIIAFDKFDPSRSKIKEELLDTVEALPEEFTFIELSKVIGNILGYGDVGDKFQSFSKLPTITKPEVIKWVNKNIHNAKFSSIATMWIRAYILIELNKNSRIIKKPKSEILADKELHGAYRKESFVSMDDPIGDPEDGITVGDRMMLEDDTPDNVIIGDSYDIFKNGLMKLLHGVKARDRAVFLKKYGIGLPRPMLPKEIADQYGLSIARVSQILQSVTETIHKNQSKFNVDPDELFAAVKNLY